MANPLTKPLGRKFILETLSGMRLKPISIDENLTFVIGDPMKKVHIDNKSLVNPASTNKIVPSYGVVMVLECII